MLSFFLVFGVINFKGLKLVNLDINVVVLNFVFCVYFYWLLFEIVVIIWNVVYDNLIIVFVLDFEFF